MLIWKWLEDKTRSDFIHRSDRNDNLPIYHIHCTLFFCFILKQDYQIKPWLFFCSRPDDVSEVGEEDSFLGQTSSTGAQPATFTYFSASGGSSDPFASIGPQSFLPPASSVVPTATSSLVSTAASLPSNPPISHVNSAQQYGNTVYQNPISTHTPSPNVTATPPPQTSQHPFNPYRHTATSSKASPYIMAPELQQLPHQTPHHHSPYSQTPLPPTFLSAPPNFTQVRPLVSQILILLINTAGITMSKISCP